MCCLNTYCKPNSNSIFTLMLTFIRSTLPSSFLYSRCASFIYSISIINSHYKLFTFNSKYLTTFVTNHLLSMLFIYHAQFIQFLSNFIQTDTFFIQRRQSILLQKQNKHIKEQTNNKMDTSTLNFIYFLAVIGGIWFIILITKILWNLIKLVIPSKNFIERYGPNTWAVITGGSDGLGLGFCQQLAELGFNICMIARNQKKMEQALEKLKYINQKKNVETKFIVADFAESQNPYFFNKIFKQLQGLDVSILVNNVGISNIGYFHTIPDKRIMNEININIVAMSMMSHQMIPIMLRRSHRSAIVNISSFSAQHPIPYISNYSSSKSYNDVFSRAIEMEYSNKIDVLSVRPLYVESKMSKQKRSCSVASRNQCAKSALSYLGIDYETNGVFVHRLIAGLVSCLPEPIVRLMSQSSSRSIMQKQQQQQQQIQIES